MSDLQLAVDLGDKPEKVVPWANVRWHELGADSDELKAELHRLRGWLTEIAVPVLGWEGLPPVRALSTSWRSSPSMSPGAAPGAVADRGPEPRDGGQQADYLLRVMPGLQAVVKQACAGCEHQMDPSLRQFTRRQAVK